MTEKSKSLKAHSLEDIEQAIADALSKLTGRKIAANISLLKQENVPYSTLTGAQQFSMELSLNAEADYGESVPPY